MEKSIFTIEHEVALDWPSIQNKKTYRLQLAVFPLIALTSLCCRRVFLYNWLDVICVKFLAKKVFEANDEVFLSLQLKKLNKRQNVKKKLFSLFFLWFRCASPRDFSKQYDSRWKLSEKIFSFLNRNFFLLMIVHN